MEKEQVLLNIKKTGIVAVVRAKDSETALKIADACLSGGINAIEITFTVPFAHKVLETLAKEYGNDLILGAGTVLDSETARIALLSGADFIVSPHFDENVVKLCHRYRKTVMQGVMSVREAVLALEAGTDILKVFPADLFGPNVIKAFKGPLPQGQFMPTGGVDVDNVDEWISAGSALVGVGGSLTGGAKTGDYAQITKTAKLFVHAIKKARNSL